MLIIYTLKLNYATYAKNSCILNANENDDPEDNKFLACAMEAEADYVISGDKYLINLHQ